MKFTLSWLKRHLDTDASLEKICATLTNIGLELEGLEDPSKTYEAFTVAYVEKTEAHPDADKLQVCTVKTKNDTLQVVCGAHNAKTGMYGIFAPEGSYVPGLDFTLKKTKIRGVESNGMLVSEKEMMLSEEHDGIIELEGEPKIGTPMVEVFGLDDPIIEINLTPNRADCAGIRGIARDLAAAGLGTLKPLDTAAIKGTFTSDINVSIEDTEGCPLFLSRYIKNVKNGPSPDWFQTLLKAIGLRPISALVDITNFMVIDHARPLHVYDANKLTGNITVRETKGDENLEALNDKSYAPVAPGAIGIYDGSKENGGLIGLGGIIGGAPTGSTNDTTNVLLECAYFNPSRIARTGRDMSIISDARYRFERGVDPEFTAIGIDIATTLILEFCGGEASEIIRAGDVPDWKREIEYDPAYVEKLIGLDVPEDKQLSILTALGFKISGKGPYKITPPSWRGDVHGAADIAEEIIRIVGFDQIPSVSVHGENTGTVAETPLLNKGRKARNALTARGFDECVTWSFMKTDTAKIFGLNDNQAAALTLKNSISSEIDTMRPSILPNLISTALQNTARGFGDVALCEVGPVFESAKPDGQKTVAAGIRAGNHAARHWSDQNAARPVDAYDAKADAIAALQAAGAPAANAQITRDAPDYFHPGRSGALRLGKTVLAYFGELHPAALEHIDAKGAIVGFEVFLENIPTAKKKSGTEKQLLKLEPLQPLSRDFAFLVDETVEAKDLIGAAKAADKTLITAASIFDIYQGKGVEEGKKSVALSITIQPREDNLTDKDIEALCTKVTENVEKKTGGPLRG